MRLLPTYLLCNDYPLFPYHTNGLLLHIINRGQDMELSNASACFREELTESELGVSLRVCYNCSTCATACPVALETEGRFNPRTIIQLANCGYEDRLLFDFAPDVFDCTCCEICQEVCPQNVNLHETFIIIKNLRAQESYIPDSYTDETEQVYTHGKAVPVQASINKRRVGLGLSESPQPNAEEIRKLMDMTPVKDVLARKAQQKAEASAEAAKEQEETK